MEVELVGPLHIVAEQEEAVQLKSTKLQVFQRDIVMLLEMTKLEEEVATQPQLEHTQELAIAKSQSTHQHEQVEHCANS